MQIFPALDCYIGDNAINISVTLSAGSNLYLKAYSATQWEVIAENIVTGTSGYVLTSNGAAVSPSYQALADATIPVFKSYSFKSRDGANGENFLAGYYFYPAADVTLSNANLTQTFGAANVPYAAHAFCVLGGAGTTDGSDMIITVSGTSITDAGVRTGTDSQVLVADCTAGATDQYYETSKKWIGQITYTVTSTAGGTFTVDFNYGFCKYEDFGNRSFTLTDFEAVGLCNVDDNSFNIEIMHHKATGWTYSAAAFVAGAEVFANMNTIHGTEQDPDDSEYFAFKRASMTEAINGADSEGVIIRITTSVNNSITRMDTHIGVVFT